MISSARLPGVAILLLLAGCLPRDGAPKADSVAVNTPARDTAAPAHAALDPEIEFVVTGGSWDRGDQSGHYRIVVRNTGFEHVSSRVHVEWLATNPDSGTFVRASVKIDTIPGGMYSIGLPALERRAGAFELVLSGTHTYALNERKWRFALGEPGAVRTVSDSTP